MHYFIHLSHFTASIWRCGTHEQWAVMIGIWVRICWSVSCLKIRMTKYPVGFRSQVLNTYHIHILQLGWGMSLLSLKIPSNLRFKISHCVSNNSHSTYQLENSIDTYKDRPWSRHYPGPRKNSLFLESRFRSKSWNLTGIWSGIFVDFLKYDKMWNYWIEFKEKPKYSKNVDEYIC